MQSKCIICILLLLDETGLVNEKPELLKEVWVFICTSTFFLFFFLENRMLVFIDFQPLLSNKLLVEQVTHWVMSHQCIYAFIFNSSNILWPNTTWGSHMRRVSYHMWIGRHGAWLWSGCRAAGVPVLHLAQTHSEVPVPRTLFLPSY